MNYEAYFKSLSDILYRVRIITDKNSNEFKEYPLSGSQPVTVTYTPSNRLFDSVRTSTCTVRLLVEDYPLDIYSGKANGTEVILEKQIGDNVYTTEWQGYVQPNLYNQGYSEPIEVLEIECSDYLSTLQYYDYTTVGPKKDIVSFLDIIKKMFDHFPRLKGFYYSLSTFYNDRQSETALKLDKMYISEENFFSKEDEPWKLSEVLDEMMKFLGMTIFQDKDKFIITDYSCRKTGQETCIYYDKTNNYSDVITSIGTTRHINSEDYRLTGADMSLDDVFNKVSVKDSFYNVSNLLPDLFDKKKLRNLNGDFDTIFHRKAFLIPGRYSEIVPADPNQGDCYYKFYDHKDWKQHCYTLEHLEGKPNEVFVPDNYRGDTTSMRKYLSPALINFGFRLYYKKDETIDFKNYLVLCQQQMPIHYISPSGFQILESGYVPLIDTTAIAPMIYGDDSWLILSCDSCKTFWCDRPWLNTDSKTMHKNIDVPKITHGYVGKYYDYKINGLNLQPEMVFKLRINGRWWNGTEWQPQECNFKVKTGKLTEDSFFQTNVGIINNVDAKTFVGEVGYRIKMPEIENTATDIYFAICPPKPLIIADCKGQDEGAGGDGETWISNISFKIVKQGQQVWSDDDVIYSNVIDDDNVVDGPEISCKFTTDAGKSFSYSNVGVKMVDGKIIPMTNVKKKDFERYQRPEENIVQSYVNQYSTPSIKENVTLNLNYDMNDIITDNYWNKKFLVLGTDKDYAYDRQTLTLIENK